jgi:multicomponent Na+:H+ antiporter subunit F
MTISSLSLMGIIAHYAERMIYLDVILVYGLLSFLGVIIIGRYIEKGL